MHHVITPASSIHPPLPKMHLPFHPIPLVFPIVTLVPKPIFPDSFSIPMARIVLPLAYVHCFAFWLALAAWVRIDHLTVASTEAVVKHANVVAEATVFRDTGTSEPPLSPSTVVEGACWLFWEGVF